MPKNIRIIPRLDIKGPNVVKGIHTEGLRVVGEPIKLAKKYYRDGADEIFYMDIVASLYQRNLDLELLRSVASEVFIPLTVGGGIRSIHDINNVLRAGADKVAINTYAIRHPQFLREAVRTFGAQCIVLSVEAKKVSPNSWEAYTDGGREKTGLDAIKWIKQAIQQGIGEILLTSIDADGTRKGYDTDLCKAVTSFSKVPVVIHGGGGTFKSFSDAYMTCNPDAISASTVFHYGDLSIKNLKNYLSSKKIKIRTE
ncbi:MAG TPA: imidazole glycerol phosphate synthase cyclase subunit [Candidatus Paceibacterota bacterium]